MTEFSSILVTGEVAAAVVEAYAHALPAVQGAIGLELGKMKQPGVSSSESLAAATRIRDMLVGGAGVPEKKAPQDVRIIETDMRTVFVYIDGKLAWQDSIIDTERLIARLDSVRLYSMEVTSREHDCLNRDFPPQDISEIEDRLEEDAEKYPDDDDD